MCDIMELSNKMAIEENNEEIVLKALNMNLSIEQITQLTGFSEAKIRKIQEDLLVEA